MKNGTMSTTKWVEVDVDVEINVDDIMDFIEHYATDSDMASIKNLLTVGDGLPSSSLIDTMKNDIFIKASNKYTLEELEERLSLTHI